MNQQEPFSTTRELVEPMPTASQPDDTSNELSVFRSELSTAQREIKFMRQALATARDRERVLAYELQHRVRNMLALIRSIFRRTREVGASQDEFAEHFQDRLDAVARCYARTSDIGLPGIDLENMLRDELLQACCEDGPTCVIGGPQVYLSGSSAELMTLAVHELVGNSIKFGALAQGGMLQIEWSLDAGEPLPLRFCWTEDGVSPVSSAPRPSGFGRQLIEEALPYQLGATTTFDLRPGGVECSILLPLLQPTEAHHDQLAESATSPLLQTETE